MIFRIMLLLFAFCISANAQEMSPQIQLIFQQTMSANGYLTPQMHKEFWTEIKQMGTPQEVELMKKSLTVGVLDAQEYQKELWASAKISYENRRVIKTQRLIEIEKELPINFGKSLAFPKNSENYRQAMITYKKQTKISMENSKRLLYAAAERTSLTSVQGPTMQLDKNMINLVLKNLNASFKRLGNLFNENWDGN